MLKCRTVEERIRLLFRQGRFSGNYFPAVGQEATEVGATEKGTVNMSDMAFLPATITVNLGQEVVWKNSSRVFHNVVDEASNPEGDAPFFRV
jgi:plastocyanin